MSSSEFGMATVAIYVRSRWGTSLQFPASVHLFSRDGRYDQTQLTKTSGEVVFAGVPLGNLVAEVSSPGSFPARENITVQLAGNYMTVVMKLTPLQGSATAPVAPSNSPIGETSYNLQKELADAVSAMRGNDTAGAKKKLQKAVREAPRNPEPPYLLGLLALQTNDIEQAKLQLEKSISISPSHARALTALGEALIREGNHAEASRVLARALNHDPSSWQTHALYSSTMLREKQNDAARLHAERALELSNSSSPEVRLLVAQAYLALNDGTNARKHLDSFLKQWPNHLRAGEVRTLLESTEAAGGPKPEILSPPLIRGALPDLAVRGWMPADVDTSAPVTSKDVPCTLSAVLEAAGIRAKLLVDTLQRIAARETIEQAVLDRNGQPKSSEKREYNYLVTIRQHPQSLLSVVEDRDGKFTPKAFTSGMAASGLPVMALIFHPFYAPDYDMRCEGLADWKGQPAWLVYFRHRPGRKNNFFAYVTQEGDFDVRLKGRAWIATKTGDVLHMETDLADPIPAVQLSRSHLVIEYGPHSASESQDSFWLPVSAELFTEVKGRRARIRHSFSDFRLFSVTTENKITPPKLKDPSIQP